MYHGLVPWKAYCSLLFPTGHCTACISMSHRPSLFSAKSTLPVIHFIHQRDQQQHPIIVKTTSSNTAIIMIIILIPLKGAIRDFFFFFFTISSLRRELSLTCTFKKQRRNRVQITCNTSGAHRVLCVVCHVVRSDSSAVGVITGTPHKGVSLTGI